MRNFVIIFTLLFYTRISAQQFVLKIPFPKVGTTKGASIIPVGDNVFASCNARYNPETYQLYNKSDYGLAYFNIPSWSWKLYKNHSTSVAYEYITDVAVTSGGKVWLSALNGLFYIDPQDTLRNQYFNKSNSSLINDTVLCLTLVNDKIWAVTKQGISVYDGNTFSNYSPGVYPVLRNRITKAVTNTAGEVFLASNKGLIRYSNNSFNLMDSTNSVLKSNKITALCTDKNNNVWIGTAAAAGYHTLYQYNQGLQQIMPDKCNTLLNTITSIAADDYGRVAINVVNDYPYRLAPLNLYIPQYNKIYPSLQKNYSLFSNGKNIYGYADMIKDTLYIMDADTLVMQASAVKETSINVNNISLPILTGGDFGWDLNSTTTQAPKGSCKSNLFAGSLWLGAMVDNNVHLAAQTYRQNGNDFYPGPVCKSYSVFNKQMQAEYNRFWKIEKLTINKFKDDFARGQAFAIPEAILTWPAHGDTIKGQMKNMAPFVDVNGDGRYNPYQGDYPDIKGDMSVFWVMNDYDNIHAETNSKPLEFEIHGMAYAYVCTDIKTGAPDEAVNNTVFLQYRIFNRSNRSYTGVKSAIWLDIDNGNSNDDYIGCNPKVGYGYGYNGDNFDEGAQGYGAFPPATAVLPMGNDSTRSALSNFHYYYNDFSLTGNPSRPEHYWNYFNSKFKDWVPVTYGGNGRNTSSSDSTTFMYPGKDDVNGRPEWSEGSVNNAPGDRRFLVTAHPFNLAINADTTITYAIVYSRTNDSTAYPNPIVNKLEHDVKKVKGWFAKNSFPACGKPVTGLKESGKESEGMKLSLYPNPAGNKVTIQHDNRGLTSVNIYDLSGKLVMSKSSIEQAETIDVSSLKPGFYMIRVESGEVSKSMKFIKL